MTFAGGDSEDAAAEPRPPLWGSLLPPAAGCRSTSDIDSPDSETTRNTWTQRPRIMRPSES